MIVPTVERGLWPDDFCGIEIDGLKPADVIDVGLGHLPQELPGEAGQAFDVPPLPFGIERVERQRAFARAADAGEANQLVPRQRRDRRCAGYARAAPLMTISEAAIIPSVMRVFSGFAQRGIIGG